MKKAHVGNGQEAIISKGKVSGASSHSHFIHNFSKDVILVVVNGGIKAIKNEKS